MRRVRDDSAPATVKRELAWAFALACAGGVGLAWYCGAASGRDRAHAETISLGVVLAVLAAIAAFREPRLGCAFPLALGTGAVVTDVVFLRDPYWLIGMQILALATLPFFVIATVAQTLGRAHRRRGARRRSVADPPQHGE